MMLCEMTRRRSIQEFKVIGGSSGGGESSLSTGYRKLRVNQVAHLGITLRRSKMNTGSVIISTSMQLTVRLPN